MQPVAACYYQLSDSRPNFPELLLTAHTPCLLPIPRPQGASRNYEPWRDQDVAVAEAVKTREEEEMGNAMKALENRTLDSKVRRPAALLPHTTPPHPTPLHKTPHHPIPLFTMAMHDDDDEKYPRFLTYIHTFSHTSARWTSWLHWTRCRASTRGTTSEWQGGGGRGGTMGGGGTQTRPPSSL